MNVDGILWRKSLEELLQGRQNVSANMIKGCLPTETNQIHLIVPGICFYVEHFLKSVLNLLQYCFCFMFWGVGP